MTNLPPENPTKTNSYGASPTDQTGRPIVMGRPAPPPKRDGWKNVLSTVAILLVAPLVALLLTMFIFQSYQVEGSSMQPTLQNSDRLIIWKLPRTWAKIFNSHYTPDRGDIIVFTEPKLEMYGQEANKQLIKRVIALPGERVVVQNGTITVYNDEHPEGFKPDDAMAYGKTLASTNHDVDVTVPEGQLFVAGDNRQESLDSRYFGPIDTDNIVGKLSVRVLPLNKIKTF